MAWLSGYSKRKPLTLTGGASGAQTDFQLSIAVSYEAAMQGDFDDIRFTRADGTTLVDAWAEVIIADTSATVWVEFPTTPANTVEQDYYMYYGNGSAVSDWDIGAMSLFGDDFTENTLPQTITLSSWSKNRASYIVGDILYLTHYQGLSTYNISDPTSPTFLSTHTFGTYVLDIVVDGNYAYCSDSQEDRIWVINVSNPSSMSTTGNVQDTTYLDFAHGIAKTGDYIVCCAYLAHSLTIVDVSTPSTPSVVGHVTDATNLKWIHDVVLDGNNAFVACHGSNVSSGGTITCVNISNKSSPSITSSLSDTELCHASDIQKKGDYCFVGCWKGSATCGSSGCSIQVVDVSNPSSMSIVESLAGSRGYILDIYGDYLYSANGEGVYTTYPVDKIDITDPLNISLVHRYDLPSGTAFRHVLVTPDGNYLIVADHTEPATTAPFYIISEDPKWDDTVGTPVVNAGNLELQNGDYVRASKYSTQYGRCKFRAKKSSTSSGIARIGMSNTAVSGGFYDDDAFLFYKYNTADIKAGSSNESTLEATDTGINYAADVFQTFELLWKSGEVKVLVDDVLGDTYTTNVPDEALNPRAEVAVAAVTEYIDWYFISKYVAGPPTYAFGSEESAPIGVAPTAVFYGPFFGPFRGPI